MEDVTACDQDSEVEAEWVEKEEDEEGNSDLSFYAEYDLIWLESQLANTYFSHAFVATAENADIPMVMTLQDVRSPLELKGLKIDTGANKSSIIGISQYDAYCRTFGLVTVIRPCTRRVKGIGGKRSTMRETVIQTPFVDWDVIIDVRFIILDLDIPSLLSTKDLLTNGLDIYRQECVIKHGYMTEGLQMVDFFIVYKWYLDYLTHDLYTETELRMVNRTFVH